MNYTFDLGDVEFRFLKELVHERYGISFRDDKASFVQMKLGPVVASLGMRSFAEYVDLLLYGQEREKERELGRMISLLTNNETYFFRETSQLDVFRDALLPEFYEVRSRRGEKALRVVSAGCSTGEEVYTLASLAFDSGRFFWGWDPLLLGLDVDGEALRVARQGLYYERSFRMAPDGFRQRFFAPQDGGYRVKESLAKIISFRPANITEAASWEDIEDVDAIFCRNVFIYFSERMIRRTVTLFHGALREGGYLLLGHSETLAGISEAFDQVRFPGTLIYRKRGGRDPSIQR